MRELAHRIHGQEAEKGNAGAQDTFSFAFSLGPQPID